MANCTFCGKQLETGTGFKVFKKDGSALTYCSRKCQRYVAMGRKPARYKWAKKV